MGNRYHQCNINKENAMSLYGKLDTNSNAPKYLDRGQIPAVNVTSGGTGYTDIPTVAIAAPASGIQATATARMGVVGVTSLVGGTGYAVGDVLTLVGGTGTAAILKVLTLSTTAIATVEILNPGSYSALPADVSAVTATGGSGTSATFNLTFKVVSITVTNPGNGYVAGDAAGVTFGSGNATAAVAKHGNAFSIGQNANQVVIFVSVEEAALDVNKQKGLNAPGWWLFRTYVDSSGTTRYKAEMLANITNTEATDNTVTSDDEYAADANSTVVISEQPTAQLVANEEATFTVATTTTGNKTYQWQKKPVGGRWANVTNKTTASATFTGLTAADNGNLYRAVVGNDIGAIKVYSNSAALTYTPTYISVQPATTGDIVDGAISFSVTAVAPSGTMAYAWETRPTAGTWASVGTDSNSLALTGLTAANDNDEVRVTVTNSNGDAAVVSSVAIMNFVSAAA